jgi:hypothetical protein
LKNEHPEIVGAAHNGGKVDDEERLGGMKSVERKEIEGY